MKLLLLVVAVGFVQLCLSASITNTNETTPKTINDDIENDDIKNDPGIFRFIDINKVPADHREKAELYLNHSKKMRSKAIVTSEDAIETLALSFAFILDMDISKVNETFFEQQMIYKNKSISTMDNEAKKMETNDLFFNKLNAPRTESLMTIIKGNYPDATEAERYESEVELTVTLFNKTFAIPKHEICQNFYEEVPELLKYCPKYL